MARRVKQIAASLLETVVDFLEDEPGDVESDVCVEVPCALNDLLDFRLPEVVLSADKKSSGDENEVAGGVRNEDYLEVCQLIRRAARTGEVSSSELQRGLRTIERLKDKIGANLDDQRDTLKVYSEWKSLPEEMRRRQIEADPQRRLLELVELGPIYEHFCRLKCASNVLELLEQALFDLDRARGGEELSR